MIFEYLHQKKNVNIYTIFKIPVNIIDLLREIDSNLEKIITELCSRRNVNRSQLCQTLQGLSVMYQSQLQAFRIMHEKQKMQYAYQLQQHMQQTQLQQQRLQEMTLHNKNVALTTVKNSPCKLPELIEYTMGKHKIVFHLEKNSDIKKQLENTPLCRYYNLLNEINDKEQFKRVKIIMHDMVENKKMETIDKRIDAEANYEPLKSLLLAKQGGFIRKTQTKRLRRKNKTHKR